MPNLDWFETFLVKLDLKSIVSIFSLNPFMIRFELKNTNKLRDNTMVEVKMNRWFRYLGFLKIINRKHWFDRYLNQL